MRNISLNVNCEAKRSQNLQISEFTKARENSNSFGWNKTRRAENAVSLHHYTIRYNWTQFGHYYNTFLHLLSNYKLIKTKKFCLRFLLFCAWSRWAAEISALSTEAARFAVMILAEEDSVIAGGSDWGLGDVSEILLFRFLCITTLSISSGLLFWQESGTSMDSTEGLFPLETANSRFISIESSAKISICLVYKSKQKR